MANVKIVSKKNNNIRQRKMIILARQFTPHIIGKFDQFSKSDITFASSILALPIHPVSNQYLNVTRIFSIIPEIIYTIKLPR